ncbi:unnamed protein product, partial [Mesorhabditis belari]|uniref:FAST kinase domain-containing protein 4 n=1 Tax=Mesorhabditis belari TaxID=2138241 RepID=A0AAF3FP88_9BILA
MFCRANESRVMRRLSVLSRNYVACRSLSSVATKENVFESLVDNLLSENPTSNSNDKSPTTSRLPSKSGFSQLANSPKINLNEALELLHVAKSYNIEKRTTLVRELIQKVEFDPDDTLKLNEEDLSTALAVMIETTIGNSKSPLFEALLQKFKELIEQENCDINVDVLIRLMSAAKKAQYYFPSSIQEKLHSELSKRISTTSMPRQLLGILKSSLPNNSDSLKLIASSAKKLLPVMNVDELVSLIEQFASRGNRDKECIDQAINRIVMSSQSLSVNQGVILLTSLCRLHIFDARIIRKIVNDLNEKGLMELKDWNQVTSLANSLTRLRVANPTLWNMLGQWVVEKFASKDVEKIGLFVSGMAHLGVVDKHGRELATRLAKILDKQKAKSENVWLSSMTSLAYYGVLPGHLAETILNKDFVAHLCNSLKQSPENTMYHLLRIMRINSYVKNCIQDYHGPTFDLAKEFRAIPEMTQIARKLKYGGNSKEEGDFLDILYKVTPLSHCRAPRLHESGTYVEAEIKPVEFGSTKCIAVNEWANDITDKKTRPILYFPWNQIHYTYDLTTSNKKDTDVDDDHGRESRLLGFHQMGIQLLRMEGYNPLVILDTELRQHAEISETISYLKKRISV